jgi:hypothetical protein
MIKQLVHYKAPSGRNVSRTFYFNLTKYEVAGEMRLEEMHARFKRFQDEVIDSTPAGETREMSPPEIREMLDMVKAIVEYAYGEYKDTPEGGEIRKKKDDPEVWIRFVASGGFDAFIWYLFEDGNRANAFMTNIWPEEYRGGARPATAPVAPEATDDGIPSLDDARDSLIPSLEAVPDIQGATVTAAEEKAWHDYARNELLAMSDDDFDALANRSKKGNNLPFQLIQIGMERSNRGTTE